MLTLAKAKTDLTITETMKRVGVEYGSFPLKNVKHFLYRLKNKGLIKKSDGKGFEILDPMFREYILLKSLTKEILPYLADPGLYNPFRNIVAG